MLDKLEALYIKYKDLEQQLSDPAVVGNLQLFKRLGKEYRDLEPIVRVYEQYANIVSNIKYNKQILAEDKDSEMRDMARMELDELESEV